MDDLASYHPDWEMCFHGQGVCQSLAQEERLREVTEAMQSSHIGDYVRKVFPRPALEVKVRLLTMG